MAPVETGAIWAHPRHTLYFFGIQSPIYGYILSIIIGTVNSSCWQYVVFGYHFTYHTASRGGFFISIVENSSIVDNII
jgi:hypothetical protein